jgi:hypothetical protein
VVREGVGAGGGEMTQALYAHMNNKTIKKRKKQTKKKEVKVSKVILNQLFREGL